MAKEIHVTKPLAVGNDSVAKGFLSLFFEVIFTLIPKKSRTVRLRSEKCCMT